MNRLTTVDRPAGLTRRSIGYDADGNQVTVKDPLGRITTTVYDALNRPTVVIDPMGNRTTTTYDADGETLHGDRPAGPDHDDDLHRCGAGWPRVTDPLGYHDDLHVHARPARQSSGT